MTLNIHIDNAITISIYIKSSLANRLRASSLISFSVLVDIFVSFSFSQPGEFDVDRGIAAFLRQTRRSRWISALPVPLNSS